MLLLSSGKDAATDALLQAIHDNESMARGLPDGNRRDRDVDNCVARAVRCVRGFVPSRVRNELIAA